MAQISIMSDVAIAFLFFIIFMFLAPKPQILCFLDMFLPCLSQAHILFALFFSLFLLSKMMGLTMEASYCILPHCNKPQFFFAVEALKLPQEEGFHKWLLFLQQPCCFLHQKTLLLPAVLNSFFQCL